MSQPQPQFELKSALHKIVEAVDEVPGYEEKKALALQMVGEMNINDFDKKKMLMIIQFQCPNSYKLTQYLYNSMLKFEGLGSVSHHRY